MRAKMLEKVERENSIIVRIVVEINLVKKQSDEKPKRKNKRMKLWQKREAALKASPML